MATCQQKGKSQKSSYLTTLLEQNLKNAIFSCLVILVRPDYRDHYISSILSIKNVKNIKKSNFENTLLNADKMLLVKSYQHPTMYHKDLICAPMSRDYEVGFYATPTRPRYTVKKRFASFPSPAGMSLPNSPWAEIMTS